MKISCGIIILNELNEILLGHVTGQKHNDIPKGLLDDGESEIDCAIRECKEETSIVFNKEDLTDLGLHAYLKDKKLHLFLAKVNKSDIKMEDLKCDSYFEHFYTKKLTPEVDGFNWYEFNSVENYTAKNMGKLLSSIKLESNKLKL